jgi:hypothetical protein
MAPRKASTASEGSKPKRSRRALDESEEPPAKQSLGDTQIDADEEDQHQDYGRVQRSFLASMTSIKDDDPCKDAKQQALVNYRSLPLRSAKKHELLKRWSKDKSCGWMNTFKEANEYEEKRSESVSDGWGTKSLSCIY